MKTRTLQTADGDTSFRIRLDRVNSVGLATTRSGISYFLLDSGDYWYDVIQDAYPREQKCRCGNKEFTGELIYYLRETCEEVRQVDLVMTCNQCGLRPKTFSLEIKYSPTEMLWQSPLVYCEKPKVKYNTKQISCFWRTEDVAQFIEHLYDIGLQNYCWRFADDTRRFGKVPKCEAVRIATSGKFLTMMFSQLEYDFVLTLDEIGPHLQENEWRTKELIELSAPLNMLYSFGWGHLYYVKFAAEIFRDGAVQRKSVKFDALTRALLAWMGEHFVSKRGLNCFDSPEELARLFAKRFA